MDDIQTGDEDLGGKYCCEDVRAAPRTTSLSTLRLFNVVLVLSRYEWF